MSRSKKFKVDLDNLAEPEIIAQEIIENLENALNDFKNMIGKQEEPDNIQIDFDMILES